MLTLLLFYPLRQSEGSENFLDPREAPGWCLGWLGVGAPPRTDRPACVLRGPLS